MKTGPKMPFVQRLATSVPTADSARETIFGRARNWKPSNIEIYGHSININIPTGNLVLSTGEVAYPYYNFSLGISRTYDTQEQHMQLLHLRDYPNVDPKPHWFGNWKFAYEVDVDEVWHNTYPELHVTSGIGANGLFEIDRPDFKRNITDNSLVAELLKTYGIPGRTLAELGWKFVNKDFLLRTLRGSFQILAGHFQEETLVDDINAEMWLFNPVSGSAFRITSEYFFNIPKSRYREVGYPLIVTKLIDALGHKIEFRPSSGTPPYKRYSLVDGSGRRFNFELDEEMTFLDGRNPGGEVRKYLVSKVVDGTKTSHNEFNYTYNGQHLLEKVVFPSSIGSRYVSYHYEDALYPGVLTAIENSYGNKIEFEYIEDPCDNDDRLSPRLKIKKITDPEGIMLEYEYDHVNSEVFATISQNSNIDRKIKYTYLRDIHNTKKRYITSTEIEVRRGYVSNSSGNVVPRQPGNPQIIRNQTVYTNDGRFNVDKNIDSLNRTIRYKYNDKYGDFNLVEKVWDFDNHLTEYTYDIPAGSTPSKPRCYDILSVRQENIRHIVDPANPRNIIERATEINKGFKYDKYDGDNSSDNADHGKQSTHRISEETDKRGKVWTYTYDDSRNYNPINHTLIESPLNIKTHGTYNNRGERETVEETVDSTEVNLHTYKYNTQGMLTEYMDPNQEKIKLTYYPCGNWRHTFEDQLAKVTEFVRHEDGEIIKVIDPVRDTVDYDYYKNGRLFKIINHRPAVPQDPSNPSSLVADFPNLETAFRYTPLGRMNYLINPKKLELILEYDEAGRMFQWYHNISNYKTTKFLYDVAGQLKTHVDRKNKSTVHTYYKSGFVETVRYPEWHDGTHNIPGKFVENKKYDYLGKVLTVVDSEIPGAKHYIYDEAGNIVLRRDPSGFELQISYDDDNRLWYVKDSTGYYELTLNLDGLGRPKTLQDSAVLDGSLLWNYKYKKQVGSVTKVLNLFERSLPQIGMISAFDYDNKNHLISLGHAWTGTPPASIYSQAINYRNDNLIDSITGDDANGFRFDGIKQLIGEHVGNLSSDYDEAGNRSYRVNKTVMPSPIINVYNDINQLENEKGVPIVFNYDDNGNILTSTYPIDPTTYQFDGDNRLRLIKNSQHEISYLYDKDGKLLQRNVKDIASGRNESTDFSYLFAKPIVIKRNGSPLMLLSWDTNGSLLRIRKPNNVGGAAYPNSLFPLYDGLGNIVRMLDGDKRVVVSVGYDAWGNIQHLMDPGNLFEFWGYKGGILDRLTGHVLFGARWYSPVITRWLSEDPYVQSDNYRVLGNLYVYALNAPVTFSDPTGLKAEHLEFMWKYQRAIQEERRVYEELKAINRKYRPELHRLMIATEEGPPPPGSSWKETTEWITRVGQAQQKHSRIWGIIEGKRQEWLQIDYEVSILQGVDPEDLDYSHIIGGAAASTAAGAILGLLFGSNPFGWALAGGFMGSAIVGLVDELSE